MATKRFEVGEYVRDEAGNVLRITRSYDLSTGRYGVEGVGRSAGKSRRHDELTRIEPIDDEPDRTETALADLERKVEGVDRGDEN